MSRPSEKNISEIKITDIEGLKERLSKSQLLPEDISTITSVLNTFVVLQNLVRKRRISILKFLRQIFGFKTEKVKDASRDNEKTFKPKEESKNPRHGRNGREDYPGCEKIKVSHPSLKIGCECPECFKGVLREAEPCVDYDWQGHPPLVLKIYLLQRFICHICKTTFTAPSPIAETSKTVDDSTALVKVGRCDRNAMANAVVTTLRFWYGVPHYRLAKIQGSMGMALPVGTQYKMLLQVYYACLPMYFYLMEQAAQGSLFFADDTDIKILDWLAGKGPKNKTNDEKKKKAQTTAIVSEYERRQIVLYLTGADQAGSKMKALLENRKEDLKAPIYMCDALSSNDLGDEVPVIKTHCLDHGRRQFFDLLTTYPEECSYVLEQLRIVYLNDRHTKEKHMCANARLKYHQEKSRPVMENLGQWFDQKLESQEVEENSALGGAILYFLKRWTEFNEFHHTSGVPLSNGECERAIKNIIRHRKNSQAYKTENGAFVGDVIQSMAATCDKAGANLFKYLAWLQANRSLVEEDPSKFTPWEFMKLSE